MKYKLLNANAIEITEFDVGTATADDINTIINLYFNHLVVVFRAQHLSAEKLMELANKFGVPEVFNQQTVSERSPDGVNGVQRVCKGVNNNGTARGLFGHDADLDWHANRPSAEDERKPIIMLYAASNTSGSRISWINMALAYNTLDEETKIFLEDKKGIYGFEPNTYTQSFNIWKSHRNNDGQLMVRTTPTGVTGMFFPYFQFFGFKDVDKDVSDLYTQRLYNHCYQEKFMYHHDYADGDLILGDQWLTVHKRWACELGERMVYRVSTDWSKIHP
jgi:alpha-ketoglutarate-dependent taurine dioxygenase